MNAIPYVSLNDGYQIPAFGFGTFQIPADGSTYKAVRTALDLGIRHLDTAVAYFNEQEVGQAVKDSGIAREQIFITSKLWLQDYGTSLTPVALDLSLKKLNCDYIDLYLIHQPYGDVIGAWQVLEQAQVQGKIHSLGVSNITPQKWDSLVEKFATKPAVNQIEFHPYQQQLEIRAKMAQYNTRLEAWAPLMQANQQLLHEQIILDMAAQYEKTTAQIILRFELQEGAIIFPKATSLEHIKQNMGIFDFKLNPAQMQQLRSLNRGLGIHNPDNEGVAEFLLDNFDVHAHD